MPRGLGDDPFSRHRRGVVGGGTTNGVSQKIGETTASVPVTTSAIEATPISPVTEQSPPSAISAPLRQESFDSVFFHRRTDNIDTDVVPTSVATPSVVSAPAPAPGPVAAVATASPEPVAAAVPTTVVQPEPVQTQETATPETKTVEESHEPQQSSGGLLGRFLGKFRR